MNQLDLFHDAPASPSTPARVAVSTDSPAMSAPPDFSASETEEATLLTPANLAEAKAAFGDAVSDAPDRARIRSAFTSIGKVVGKPLTDLAKLAELRPLLAHAMPARAGFRPQSWSQVRSTAKRGLKLIGMQVSDSGKEAPLGPTWSRLYKTLTDRRLQIGLSRLVRFFDRRGVAPEQVTSASFDAFAAELRSRMLLKNCDASVRQVVKQWNRAVAVAPGCPQTVIPVQKHASYYSLDWNDVHPQ